MGRLGYGAMRLCGPGIIGWPDDRENALAVLRRVVELGVTLIDTADAYGPHVNELQLAEALHPYPAGLVIATKGGLIHERAASWPPNGRPEHLREACEGLAPAAAAGADRRLPAAPASIRTCRSRSRSAR